jgi:DnaJ domain
MGDSNRRVDFKGYYKLLGVSNDASQDQIKKAFRKLALRYHPDKNQGDSAATELFQKIRTAYEVLSSEDKRSQYDRGDEDGYFRSSYETESSYQRTPPSTTKPSAPSDQRGSSYRTTRSDNIGPTSLKERMAKGKRQSVPLQSFYPECQKCRGKGCEKSHRWFTREGLFRIYGDQLPPQELMRIADNDFDPAKTSNCEVCGRKDCDMLHRVFTKEGYMWYLLRFYEPWETLATKEAMEYGESTFEEAKYAPKGVSEYEEKNTRFRSRSRGFWDGMPSVSRGSSMNDDNGPRAQGFSSGMPRYDGPRSSERQYRESDDGYSRRHQGSRRESSRDDANRSQNYKKDEPRRRPPHDGRSQRHQTEGLQRESSRYGQEQSRKYAREDPGLGSSRHDNKRSQGYERDEPRRDEYKSSRSPMRESEFIDLLIEGICTEVSRDRELAKWWRDESRNSAFKDDYSIIISKIFSREDKKARINYDDASRREQLIKLIMEEIYKSSGLSTEPLHYSCASRSSGRRREPQYDGYDDRHSGRRRDQ